ncbi:hypothetical protein GCM10009661_75790 [Catellatospora chokoriensis]|uniref:Universal stress protein family protein n=1 Tax=Catellatospora chokoriensis TaxID=310353 RepID=A0A8J3KG40_9ACTN|nr:hypothetical protein Cch02nite_78930 [Catellatospora chokoriensis]
MPYAGRTASGAPIVVGVDGSASAPAAARLDARISARRGFSFFIPVLVLAGLFDGATGWPG